jgi:hypothetical protein
MKDFTFQAKLNGIPDSSREKDLKKYEACLQTQATHRFHACLSRLIFKLSIGVAHTRANKY